MQGTSPLTPKAPAQAVEQPSTEQAFAGLDRSDPYVQQAMAEMRKEAATGRFKGKGVRAAVEWALGRRDELMAEGQIKLQGEQKQAAEKARVEQAEQAESLKSKRQVALSLLDQAPPEGMTQQEYRTTLSLWLKDPKKGVADIQPMLLRERGADARDRAYEATERQREFTRGKATERLGIMRERLEDARTARREAQAKGDAKAVEKADQRAAAVIESIFKAQQEFQDPTYALDIVAPEDAEAFLRLKNPPAGEFRTALEQRAKTAAQSDPAFGPPPPAGTNANVPSVGGAPSREEPLAAAEAEWAAIPDVEKDEAKRQAILKKYGLVSR